MADLHYNVTIQAPKQKVWQVMLGPETYQAWTSAFMPGSYFDGSWDKGSDIKFLAESDGKLGGMYGRIVENIAYEFVSIEYVGQVIDGQVDTTSGDAQAWIGSHENYRLSERDGTTTVNVELTGAQSNPEIEAMFNGMWPKALEKLKQLCENDA